MINIHHLCTLSSPRKQQNFDFIRYWMLPKRDHFTTSTAKILASKILSAC